MKVIRLIIGIITAMIVLTIVVEGIELLIVRLVSGQSIEYFSNDQSEYFAIRNQTWILVLKVCYTFLAALLAGWLGSKITKFLQKQFFVLIAILQSTAFLYAMLFSEFKDTLHPFYWIFLLMIVLGGLYLGIYSYKFKIQKYE